MKAKSDLQHDATTLHALCQGAFELMELCSAPTTPASNALSGLLEVIIQRADQLAVDLDGVKA
jgi:hypothetical protein